MTVNQTQWSGDLPPLLTTRHLGRTLRHFERCESTSDEAAKLANEGCDEGALVVADQQTGGRGRQGRVWHSPPGANLYFSYVLRPHVGPALMPPLTLLTGAAVARALQPFRIECRLKWPNDIMLQTPAGLRKAGGILTEMATSGGHIKHVVVGIGLNVMQGSFPADIAQIATSLQSATDVPLRRLPVLAGFLNIFEALYDRFTRDGAGFALECWRHYGWLGHRCTVQREAGAVSGFAVDVDNSGGLIVQDDLGKRHTILSGDVVPKL